MAITVKNLQANSIVERMHLMIGDMLQMIVFESNDWWFEMNYPFQAIVWVLKTIVSSTIPYSQGTLAFNYDMIMQTKVKMRDQRPTDPKLSKPTEGLYKVSRVNRNGM
eukprot:245905-Ditylum_brightwellii.AAC.1